MEGRIEEIALFSYNLLIMRLYNDKPIVGHTKILDLLERGVKNDRLAQAYVFLGPAKVGKNTVAGWLASQLLEVTDGNLDSHPNISIVRREYDEKKKKMKSKISIEQIRNLRERLGMSSFGGGHKVAIIEEAESMSLDAANALLKTLEEPSGQTTIILIAANQSRIPATIFSRAHVLKFNLVSDKDIKQALGDNVLADELVVYSAGRPGVALSLVDDAEELEARRSDANEFWTILKESLAGRLAMAGSLPKGVAARDEVRSKLNRYEVMLRDLLLSSCGCVDLVSTTEAKRYSKEPASRWHQGLKTISDCRAALEANTNPQLVLENFLIKL